jgi:hypothetical protein
MVCPTMSGRGAGFFRPVPGLSGAVIFPVLTHWAIVFRPPG